MDPVSSPDAGKGPPPPYVGPTLLTAIRTSGEYKRANSEKLERREDDIFMLSLYDKNRGRLYCRGTPGLVINTIDKFVKKGDFKLDDRLYYYYRHGDSPEATYLTVKDFRDWLVQLVMPGFEEARKELTQPGLPGVRPAVGDDTAWPHTGGWD